MRFGFTALSFLLIATSTGCRSARFVAARKLGSRTGVHHQISTPAERQSYSSSLAGHKVELVNHQATDDADFETTNEDSAVTNADATSPTLPNDDDESSIPGPPDEDESNKEQSDSPTPDDQTSIAEVTEALVGLSLQQLEYLAIQNNPAIAHSAAQIVVAQGQHLQAGLCPNPTIGYHGVNIGNRGTAGRQAGFIQQRIITGGKLGLDQQIASHNIRRQLSELTAAQQKVLTDVRSSFYVALVAQRRAELTDRLFQIANELSESTNKLLEAEQTSENTLLQAEIEREQARILKDNATNETTEAWNRLAAVVGQPGLQRSQLAGDLENLFVEHDLDSLNAKLISTHPLITAAQARVDQAAATITRAQREVVPNLDLLFDAAKTNHTGYNTAQARVAFEVPLWDRNQGNIRAAQGELAVAQADVKRVKLKLQQKLATVFRQYSNALHQATRYRDNILPKAKRSLELVRNGYENGQVEYLTLLNSQQKFVQVNLAWIEALEDLQQAAALLDGQLLADSLDEA